MFILLITSYDWLADALTQQQRMAKNRHPLKGADYIRIT